MAESTHKMRGRSEHALDEKGRVVIPLKFRPDLEDGFVVVTGPSNCLRIYPKDVFDRLDDELQSISVLDEADEDKQLLQRLFYNADVGSMDSAFRLTIPRSLRAWAKFGQMDTQDIVIILGMGEKLELWSATAWSAYQSMMTSETIAAASRRLRSAYTPFAE